MNTKLLPLRDALRRQLAAIHLRDWLPSRGNLLFTLLVALCLIAATTSGVLAAPQRMAAQSGASTATIPYQGRLADASGAPLTGTYIIVFRLYDVASGGTALWEESWTGINSVQVTNGLFNVMLGSLTPIPQSLLNGNSSLWLGINVGSDAEMTPRVQLGSAPYAMTVPDGSITAAKLATGAVVTTNLVDGSVTTPKLNLDGLEVVTTSNGVSGKFTKSDGRGDIRVISADNGSSGIGGFSVDNFSIYEQGLKRITLVDGNVGIGTITPTEKLHIEGRVWVSGDAVQMTLNNTNPAANPTLYLRDFSGAGRAGKITTNDNDIEFGPSNTTKLIIKSNGNIGIGTTTPSNILTVGQYYGNVLADGYSIYSSGRWKENIAPIGDALSIVRQLRGVTFDWKGSGKHDLGLIAEEVGKVLPQVVTYEANGQDARGVDYSRLVAVLVQANKEQQQQITSLQQQNAALDARLAALERSGGKPADPTVGLFSAWSILVILTMAGGLIAYFRPVRFSKPDTEMRSIK